MKRFTSTLLLFLCPFFFCLVGCDKGKGENLAEYEISAKYADDEFFLEQSFDFVGGKCSLRFNSEQENKVVSVFCDEKEVEFEEKEGVLEFYSEGGRVSVDYVLGFPTSEPRLGGIFLPLEGEGESEARFFNASVDVTVPSSLVVAAPAPLSAYDCGEQNVTYRYELKKVSAIDLRMSPDYNVCEEKVGKTLKFFYYDDGFEETATRAFSFFKEKFGDFPFDELIFCESNTEGDFSGCVFFNDDVFSLVERLAEQWFTGNVYPSSDFCVIDEVFSTYAACSFFSAFGEYGIDGREILEKKSLAAAEYVRAKKSVNPEFKPKIAGKEGLFDGVLEYYSVGINGGLRALLSAENEIGEKGVSSAFKKLFSSCFGKTVGEEEVLSCFPLRAAKILRAFFEGEAEYCA